MFVGEVDDKEGKDVGNIRKKLTIFVICKKAVSNLAPKIIKMAPKIRHSFHGDHGRSV